MSIAVKSITLASLVLSDGHMIAAQLTVKHDYALCGTKERGHLVIESLVMHGDDTVYKNSFDLADFADGPDHLYYEASNDTRWAYMELGRSRGATELNLVRSYHQPTD